MLAIKADRADALQTLMDRHWQGVVRFVSRMLGSPDEAKDIGQEVFVGVWEHRARWTPGGSVQSYLYQIARNLALLRIRHLDVRDRTKPRVRRRRRPVLTPLDHFARVELEEAFEDALRSLPERRREAFLLVRFEGLSLREAADVMGISRQTVANHVSMAASDLEEALRPFLQD